MTSQPSNTTQLTKLGSSFRHNLFQVMRRIYSFFTAARIQLLSYTISETFIKTNQQVASTHMQLTNFKHHINNQLKHDGNKVAHHYFSGMG